MQDPSFYSQINNNNQTQVNQTQPQFPENEHLKCPRCDSTNTKFCYYNNYNLSQPRHFCKNCKRYWTKGGALRNIPVGGGTRKRSAGDTAAAAAKRPAPTVVPEKESNEEKGKNGETLALIGGDHFEGKFSNFSSILGEGQFGNFGEPGQGQVDNGDGFLNIESGVVGDDNTWPDLSIYTPGSTFK